ncbi:MAG TPA: hypothetical protein PKE04_02840, partial [Clostridia bacterium]|nr:hypothetical protein [Clostridia bacterium]
MELKKDDDVPRADRVWYRKRPECIEYARVTHDEECWNDAAVEQHGEDHHHHQRLPAPQLPVGQRVGRHTLQRQVERPAHHRGQNVEVLIKYDQVRIVPRHDGSLPG